MQRNTLLVLAAGASGALCTALAAQLVHTPALATTGQVVVEERSAVVDVLGLLERMLDMDAYELERDSEAARWNAELEAIGTEAQNLLASLQAMNTPEQTQTPEFQAMYTQYQTASQRYSQMQQQQGQAMDALAARQLVDAYTKIHAKVGELAESGGYTRVFSSRMHTDDMDPRSTNAVVQEFMIRPVLFDSTSENLTEAVRLALGIPDAPVVPEVPTVPSVDAPVEPGTDSGAAPDQSENSGG